MLRLALVAARRGAARAAYAARVPRALPAAPAAAPVPARQWASSTRPAPLAAQWAAHTRATTRHTRRLLTTTPKSAPSAGDRAASAALATARAVARAAASAVAVTLRSGAGFLATRVPPSAAALTAALRSPGATRRALSLRAAAWWRAHGAKVAFGGGGLVAYGLWRAATALATAVGAVTDTPAGRARVAAVAGVLAAAAALATRARLALTPAAVYHRAMQRFQADPGVLEVLGAPLAASGPRAAVETGGGWRVAPGALLPAWAPRRVVLSFPLAGAERRGVASAEAVKRNGRIVFKMLVVDVPTPDGGDARLVLEGEAARAASLADALRPPLVRAVALGRAHAAEDKVDDAADAAAAAARARSVAAQAGLEEGRRVKWWQPWLRPW